MTLREVLIVDDHALVAESVERRVRAQWPGAAVHVADGDASARRAVARGAPDLLLVDLYLPEADGIELYRELGATRPGLEGVLLSGMLGDADVQRALEAGFRAIVAKRDASEELVSALAAVHAGEGWYSPSVRTVVDVLSDAPLFSERMLEVLRCLRRGLANKQIADELQISEATVSFHIRQLKDRLGARTNRQIVVRAAQLGMRPKD